MTQEKFAFSLDLQGTFDEIERPLPPELPPEPGHPEINTGEPGIEIAPDSSPQIEPPQRQTEIEPPEQAA